MTLWRSIVTVPTVQSDMERGPQVLLSDGRNVFTGHAANYSYGVAGSLDFKTGTLDDWHITHWAPWPNLPKEASK